jgi:rhodanese-related sulfurtransferase
MIAASMSQAAHGQSPTERVVEIARGEILRRLGDRSLTLVNVLPRESFLAGRIPGSISLPLAEIPGEARRLLPDRTQELVVYCASPT